MIKLLIFLVIQETIAMPTTSCRHDVESLTTAIKKYRFHPLDDIPDPNLVPSKMVFYKKLCDMTSSTLKQIDAEDFRLCDMSFIGNTMYVRAEKDKIENNAKIACDEEDYLQTLHRCRPKGLHIEDRVNSFIQSFEFIDQDEFKEICW